MFGKKKTQDGGREPGKRKGAELMNQMGFAGIGDIDGVGYGDDDDDDLEAELAELAGEDYTPPKKSKPKKKGLVPIMDIEKLAAVGLKDLDEDVSDTEDPDILAELENLSGEDDLVEPQKVYQNHQSISPQKMISPPQVSPKPTLPTVTPAPRVQPAPQLAPAPAPRQPMTTSPKPTIGTVNVGSSGGLMGLLEERINMYKHAIAAAKTAGDSSKQRRLDRGLKTLSDQLRQAKAGKPVNEEDIPPPVAMGISVAVEQPTTSTETETSKNASGIEFST
ncbi:Coiled-coil and C2 domain-containing protein 1B [Bulinus truncatus]|nr:Coiled-coil and C2 domain-containing protein 1B [Bulinus truncatus]